MMKKMFTFDDVALMPFYNNVDSRTEPSLKTLLTKDIQIDTPILASTMDSVIGPELAGVLSNRGSMPIYHRFTISDQMVKWVDSHDNGKCFISWGVNHIESLIDTIERCVHPPLGVCFDVAHGHSLKMKQAIEEFKEAYPSTIKVIAGAVCTKVAIHDMAHWGADAIRVGIGPGSCCTTREVTGFGAPQFTAIQECAEVAKRLKIPIIADGGIRNSRDIVLALAAGASTVMIGRLFAATNESAAQKKQDLCLNCLGGGIDINLDLAAKLYNGHLDPKCIHCEGTGHLEGVKALYKGQASEDYQQEGRVPEGKEGWLPVTGSAHELLDRLEGGIRSGLTYGGARTIEELQDHAIFTEVTATYQEEMRARI
jgi:IMP dehydrogenase